MEDGQVVLYEVQVVESVGVNGSSGMGVDV